MNSKTGRLILAALVIVIAAVAFVIARPSTKSTKHASITTNIDVRGGKPVGGVRTIEASKGERVVIHVSSDVADEIHLHGYDLHREVARGGSVSFDFPARIDGAFVVELEKRAEQIASLQVRP